MWNRFSFLVKVSIRNVLRYKKRFFMMVVGIGGCTALLVTGFGIKDSIANIAGQQFTSVQTYGMSVLLRRDTPPASGTKWRNICRTSRWATPARRKARWTRSCRTAAQSP